MEFFWGFIDIMLFLLLLNPIYSFVGLIIILLVLRYMKTRIGLNPEEYNEKDINFNKLGEWYLVFLS